jgi:hypothetical protein
MRRSLLTLAFGLCIAFGLWWYFGGQGWLAVHTGTDYCIKLPAQYQTVCKSYGFWSGFGSDLGEYALLTGVLGNLALLWRKHTCHYSWWCWRHPHHNLDGTPYMLCGHHHPEDQVTVKEAIAIAREANNDQSALAE